VRERLNLSDDETSIKVAQSKGAHQRQPAGSDSSIEFKPSRFDAFAPSCLSPEVKLGFNDNEISS
jgi:hypothetical protein